MPIAVISGVRRGAERTGLYADSSISTPSSAAASIANSSTPNARASGKAAPAASYCSMPSAIAA